MSERNERVKSTILRILLGVSAGTSALGDEGTISTREISEVVSYTLIGAAGADRIYTYDLLRVLRENGLVKQIRHKAEGRDRSSRWALTRDGHRAARALGAPPAQGKRIVFDDQDWLVLGADPDRPLTPGKYEMIRMVAGESVGKERTVSVV